jgi:hypothetical protein
MRSGGSQVLEIVVKGQINDGIRSVNLELAQHNASSLCDSLPQASLPRAEQV